MEAIHPDCAIIAQHLRARETCSQARRREVQNQTARGGSVYRNCTADGWSDVYPAYEEVCDFSDDSGPESETSYLSTFRRVYTVGYATSLISLITAIVVFTAFRKFHCTRNYIHVNLFSSFVLRASAVFVKDTVLFADETLDHCSVSTVSPRPRPERVDFNKAVFFFFLRRSRQAACKSAVAFFQFSILANYFWLLVEGMYLQTLLALTFVSQRKYFWWYILTGWGLPSTILVLWVLTRFFYDDRGCWDDTDNVAIWWIIKGPITASLLVNIVIFVNVIRILVQKLKSSSMSGNNDTGHFIRLAKSTLFLIPLFGMHYTVFAFLPENTGVAARLYIELGLGSFQGFVVALLYCFMNGEVQAELRRRLWKCRNWSGRVPAKRSLSQVSLGARGGLRRPPSTGNVSTV
ncbi:growth hormone releasing hormone receptor a isoform X3 [Syngnathoides biaculeatus]|uniref:growth hormone releasing hormone receptor a isoform X3 n=1 Tax=Syngnathoides biaculeatus TaxID=300417 RepID=UPI002ADE8977|nr:growth hormone releasing hormone receptor a isoform X3 [Syngnathoides biaculeatus]